MLILQAPLTQHFKNGKWKSLLSPSVPHTMAPPFTHHIRLLNIYYIFPFSSSAPLHPHCCPDSRPHHLSTGLLQRFINQPLFPPSLAFSNLTSILMSKITFQNTIWSHHSLTKNSSVALSTALKLISKYSIQALNDLNSLALPLTRSPSFLPPLKPNPPTPLAPCTKF